MWRQCNQSGLTTTVQQTDCSSPHPSSGCDVFMWTDRLAFRGFVKSRGRGEPLRGCQDRQTDRQTGWLQPKADGNEPPSSPGVTNPTTEYVMVATAKVCACVRRGAQLLRQSPATPVSPTSCGPPNAMQGYGAPSPGSVLSYFRMMLFFVCLPSSACLAD